MLWGDLYLFDRIIIVDWSASSAPSGKSPKANTIWIGQADRAGARTDYFSTRQAAEQALMAQVQSGARLLIGFDFPLGFPMGFGKAFLGSDDPCALWHWVRDHITDGPDNRNNRFMVAQSVNLAFEQSHAQRGPFWGCPRGLNLTGLSATKTSDYAALGFLEKRQCEVLLPKSQPIWKLYTAGSVGSQSLMGLGMIARLVAGGAAVWPFERNISQSQVVLTEVYPSLIDSAVARAVGAGQIKDAAQTQLLAQALNHMMQVHQLAQLFEAAPKTDQVHSEGWILAQGQQAALLAALEG